MNNIQQHQYWMKQALALADKAEALGEVPVGALIVKNGEIIGEGFNQPISSSDPTAHAELVALRQAGQSVQNYRLIETTLYVTLEPCAMCAMAMVHARISTVVIAAPEPRTGAGGSLYQLLDHPAHNHRLQIISGIEAEASAAKLQAFFRARRKSTKLI